MKKIQRVPNVQIKNYSPAINEGLTLGEVFTKIAGMPLEAKYCMVLYNQSIKKFCLTDEAIRGFLGMQVPTPTLEFFSAYFDEVDMVSNRVLLSYVNVSDLNNIKIPVSSSDSLVCISEGRKIIYVPTPDGLIPVETYKRISYTLSDCSPVIINTKCHGRRIVNDVISFRDGGIDYVGFVCNID